jgi:hypothetical protein
MKPETITINDHITRSCTGEDRILLINPPLVETRYQWIRWNQPLDLLKMSSFLKKEVGCEVKLYDFMLPAGGRVTRAGYKPKPEIKIGDYSYTLWRYGEANEKFKAWLNKTLAKWRPTQVWITSLTSYWWLGVSDTVAVVQSIVPEAKIALYGQYPTLETAHACQNSYADLVITDKVDLAEHAADFSLYGETRPSFCGLDVRAENWHEEVIVKYREGINDFVFFNDNILESPDLLLPRLRSVQEHAPNKANRRLKFYAICGLHPTDFTESAAREMKECGFVELHFEQQLDGEELDLDAYRKARQVYHLAGFDTARYEVSGFLFIGSPNDKLELIARHMLNLLELWGTVILKPYTPTPGSADYQRHEHILDKEEIEKLGPHFFPFSQVNDISHEDYEELYTLAASLNQKVRSRAFDSFPGTLAHEMIRTSLDREVWRIGN